MNRKLIVGLALATLTLAVYWPVRQHAFINYDDPLYVTDNWHVQAGLSRPGLAWAFLNLHGEHTYWHPLTWVSHMLDCQLFGLNPGPPHLVNVAFHVANALLVLLLLDRLTGAFWRSAMVAGLFALHPLQVDTVAWVTERKNVLSTLFWLLTLWAYARYAGNGVASNQSSVISNQTSRAPATGNGLRTANHRSLITDHRLLFYLLSLFFFALGLMCKPALVTLPFVLLLLDYWPLRRFSLPTLHRSHAPTLPRSTTPPLRLLWEKLPFLALSAAAAFITIAGHHEIRAENTASLPWQWRVANALVSYARYLGKTFWPSRLAVFYPHPGVWPPAAVAGSVLLLLAVSGWVIWRARRAPYLVVGWLWFLGTLVPMIGIIQAGAQAMADRFAYVPLIGLFIMIVWAAAEWLARLGATIPCNHRWTQIDTGNAEETPGKTAPAPASGPQNLCSSVSICGSSRCGYGLAALVLAGCVFLTSRQLSYWQNTTTLFEHALQVTSNNSCAHFSLGNELADQGKTPEAMQQWETALQIEPGRADIHARIASALSRQGDFAGAIARYRRALELDPELAEALNNLAWLLATCPEAALRDGPQAVQLAEKACELTRFRRTIMVGTLAAACAQAGRFAEAVAMAQQACALAAAEGDRALLARNQDLLELYRAGQPYHEPGKATDGHR